MGQARQDELVERVRLDKWLWAARFAKTRSAATDLVLAGHVKVGGERVKPAREIAPGEKCCELRRTWKADDTLTLEMPMPWRLIARRVGTRSAP